MVAAAHTHSLRGKTFSSLGVPLEPITQDAGAFFEDHGLYSDYREVVNDAEEGRRIGVALSDTKAVILQGLGMSAGFQSGTEAGLSARSMRCSPVMPRTSRLCSLFRSTSQHRVSPSSTAFR